MPRGMKKPKPDIRMPEQVYNDGIDAMVHSFMMLIEPVIRRRCEQIMDVVEKSIKENKNDSNK